MYLIGVGLVLLALLLLSAIISGSEVAFFSITADEIEECKGKKETSENLIARLLERPKYLLAYILILNNFANVGFVTLATLLSWKIFANANQASLIVGLTAIITFILVFTGEIVPKIYAAQQRLRFAKATARMIWLGGKLVQPLAWILVSLTSVVEKRIEKKGYTSSIEEVHQALEMTTSKGISEQEKGILKGIVNFSTIAVTQIMKARVEIEGIDIEVDYHELMDKVNKIGYSRMPVYREGLDNIEGILYMKDLLPFINEKEDFEWRKLMRPAYFVPESKKIDALLEDFQQKRVHIAIVVDEYGGTEGLITMEDIIEEIVGDISDEYDEDELSYYQINDDTFDFEGKTSVIDFCKVIGKDPRVFEEIRGESESIGGMLLEVSGTLPNAGETIKLHDVSFTVTSVDNKKIKRVRVTLLQG
jgi:gliding motility-associated protein GldE